MRVSNSEANLYSCRHKFAYSNGLDLHDAISKHHKTGIDPRFITPIGVRELMNFFEGTHTSVNAVGEAELALAVTVSHQVQRQRTETTNCVEAVLTQQTSFLPAEAAAQPAVLGAN
ncbi:hypothetical protein WJX77_001415 [Trebouxia sp. C0004]